MHTHMHTYVCTQGMCVCVFGCVCVSPCLSVLNIRTFAPALVFGRDIGNRAVVTEKLGFLFFFFSGHACGMEKFLGQRLNPQHRSDNAGSTTR